MLFWRAKPRRFHLTRPSAAPAVERMDRGPSTTNALVTVLFTMATVAILAYEPASRMGSAGFEEPAQIWWRLGGYALLSSLAAIVFSQAIPAFNPEIQKHPRSLFMWGATLVALIACVRVYSFMGWPHELVPVTLAGALLTIGLGPGLAFWNILAFTIIARLTGLLVGDEYHSVLALFPGSAIVVFGLKSIRRRSRVLNIGLLAGAVHAATLFGIRLVNSPGAGLDDILGHLQHEALRGFINGVSTAFIVTGLLPILENVFRINTELSLLELADFNQPLLKKLSLEAPGTHYHSVRVSELAESAVARIGGNSLLTRVGCLYHDIGKTTKPEYFVENDPGAGARHKSLSPTMSALVIKAHVKDGVEMAEYYGLPAEVIDFITQHHGSMLIEYFYKGALEKAEEEGLGTQVDPESFRYPGPKPQSRETAVAMLADGVEASARTLTDPTPPRLEGLVRHIATQRLNDGQLSECNLTMQEMEIVIESFVRTLTGIYHSRIRYPNQKPDTELERLAKPTAGATPPVTENPVRP
ncbi:MAG: HDIG domain-containing protein [Polyangiaceae bacterium]|nr:HDIG domain-containing protein [Polyangiaceae bacterium]